MRFVGLCAAPCRPFPRLAKQLGSPAGKRAAEDAPPSASLADKRALPSRSRAPLPCCAPPARSRSPSLCACADLFGDDSIKCEFGRGGLGGLVDNAQVRASHGRAGLRRGGPLVPMRWCMHGVAMAAEVAGALPPPALAAWPRRSMWSVPLSSPRALPLITALARSLTASRTQARKCTTSATGEHCGAGRSGAGRLRSVLYGSLSRQRAGGGGAAMLCTWMAALHLTTVSASPCTHGVQGQASVDPARLRLGACAPHPGSEQGRPGGPHHLLPCLSAGSCPLAHAVHGALPLVLMPCHRCPKCADLAAQGVRVQGRGEQGAGAACMARGEQCCGLLLQTRRSGGWPAASGNAVVRVECMCMSCMLVLNVLEDALCKPNLRTWKAHGSGGGNGCSMAAAGGGAPAPASGDRPAAYALQQSLRDSLQASKVPLASSRHLHVTSKR